MKVLSLFDGISCGMLAFERAGISVEEYHASEIDKYATSISNYNYPQIIRYGDINHIDFSLFIGKIDIVIGGSPCTDLSIAKKGRKGLKGGQSRLFYKFVEAINIIKPKYFLLENVASMKQEDRDEITRLLQVEPIMINSALLSAQNRKRYYWCNWSNTQPDDKSILLKDILDSGETYSSKAKCLVASYGKSCFPYDFKRREMITERIIQRPHGFNKGKVYSDKSPAITSSGCWQENNLIAKPVTINVNPSGRGMNGKVIGINQKSGTVTYNKGEGSKIILPIRVASIDKGGQGNRIYSVEGKSVTINSGGGGGGAKTGLYKIDLPDGDYIVRKLTPLECERLQTLPENYTAKGRECYKVFNISDNKRYKVIGNGWTVDVIAHLLKCLLIKMENDEKVKGENISNNHSSNSDFISCLGCGRGY